MDQCFNQDNPAIRDINGKEKPAFYPIMLKAKTEGMFGSHSTFSIWLCNVFLSKNLPYCSKGKCLAKSSDDCSKLQDALNGTDDAFIPYKSLKYCKHWISDGLADKIQLGDDDKVLVYYNPGGLKYTIFSLGVSPFGAFQYSMRNLHFG